MADKPGINAKRSCPVESNESDKSRTCEVCLSRGFESVSATFWCQDCQEALCDSCAEYHQSMKGPKSHKIMKIEETNHSRTAMLYEVRATKHRVCDSVEELEAILQDPDFSVKTKEMKDELNRIHSDLSSVLHNREQNTARLG
ncbi:hypothetical protein CHS0354_037129 [Potamilus streckersoni]|uniref:B box-type domain-containing protein n=1 Tax=Potamilus streckersoni TaxID=2493646 RepID=A0AAE0RP80_9BIVA|nr:hypothetical protein CHS0354_037129 [Potamilus streckersoni]